MRRLASTLLATSILIAPAFAQTAHPSSKVEYGKVPAGAVLSGDLIGLTAYNGNKDSVGEIKDLVVDHGKLVGYILSVGGFLGMGERYVEVEPSSVAVSYDAGDKKWKAMVNASKEDLKAAPQFVYDDRMKH